MKQKIQKSIVIVGAGRLGVSLAQGFLRNGIEPEHIKIVQRNKEDKNIPLPCSVYETLDQVGIEHNIELIIIAVKPKDLDSVLTTINLKCQRDVPIVSAVAQTRIKDLEEKLYNKPGIFRIKPSVLVRNGTGCILIQDQSTEPLHEKVISIFSLLGDVFELTEQELDNYAWYGIHIPCVFIPKLIQSMLEGKSTSEKEKIVPILISGLEGLLSHLKTKPESMQNIDEHIDALPWLTMSPGGVNEKAFNYMEQKHAFATINAARDVYVEAGLSKT